MLDICFRLQEWNRSETKITYKMNYNKEEYLLVIYCDRKFHNRIYECDKHIPEELDWFLDTVLSREKKY